MTVNPSAAQIGQVSAYGDFEAQKAKPRVPAKPNSRTVVPDKPKKTAPQNSLLEMARYGPVVIKCKLRREQFHEFLLANGDLKIERDKLGTITIHPLMTLKSSYHEGLAFYHLQHWAIKNAKLGRAFSPNATFDLPDGSTCKPDGSWLSHEKLQILSDDEYDSIACIVPDFVIGTRSKTDKLGNLQKKMSNAWLANGVKLAWLLDPKQKKAWIYRAGQTSPEEVTDLERTLSGEEILPGFELKLGEVFG